MFSKKISACFLLVSLCFSYPAFAGEDALASWLRQQTEKHPLVQAARQAEQASEARLRAARRAVFNPQLTVDLEDAEARTNSIELSQTIDWGGVRDARTRVARLNHEIANLQLMETRQRIAAQLLTALAEWRSAQFELQLAEKRLALMARFSELAQLRHQAGDLDQVEAELATLALSEARFHAATVKAELIAKHQALLMLTADRQHWPTLPVQLPEPRFSIGLLDDLAKKLVPVRRARVAAMLAEARIAQVKSETRANPTIAVRGGKENSASLVGLNVSIPLQVRNNFRAEIEAAAIDHSVAQSEADNAYRQARGRLHAALNAFRLSLSAWQEWQKSGERSLFQQIELLQRLWRAGEISATDYLVQLKQALDTQASAYQQRTLMWRNWAEWLAASGRIEHWLQPRPLPDDSTTDGESAVAGDRT